MSRTANGLYDSSIKINLREAVFWIVKNYHPETFPVLENPIEHLLSKSNELAKKVLDYIGENEEQIEGIKNQLVPLDQLKWIRKLKMEDVLYLCNLFYHLSNNPNLDLLQLSPNEHFNVDNSIFQRIPYPLPTQSYIIEALIFNFDCAFIAPISLKVKLLEIFQSMLLQSKDSSKGFLSFINNELKDNNDFEEWIHNYLDKTSFLADINHGYVLLKYRNLDALKVLVRTASENPQNEYYLKHTLSTIKSAWSQKKHRDSKNGRKACSFQLSEKHIELLNKLTELKRRRKNEMLEILIEDACQDAGIIKKPARD